MPYRSPTEIITRTLIAAAFLDWPILRIALSDSSHEVGYWITALCLLLTSYTPIYLILINLTIPWSYRYICGVLNCIGIPALQAGTIYLFVKVWEQYVLYDNVSFGLTAIYVSLTTIVCLALISIEFFIGLVSTISLHPRLMNDVVKSEKYALFILWTVLAVLFCFAIKTILFSPLIEQAHCEDAYRFWKISLLGLGMLFACVLTCIAVWGIDSLMMKIYKFLACFYIIYFLFYSYWFNKELKTFGIERLGKCNESIFSVILVLIFNIATIMPGVVACLTLCLGICSFAIFGLFSKFSLKLNHRKLQLKATIFKPEKTTGISLKEDEVECSICLEPFLEGEKVSHWPLCNHFYHLQCLKDWTDKKLTCPLCKRDFFDLKDKSN